jgi:hypothetical protein
VGGPHYPKDAEQARAYKLPQTPAGQAPLRPYEDENNPARVGATSRRTMRRRRSSFKDENGGHRAFIHVLWRGDQKDPSAAPTAGYRWNLQHLFVKDGIFCGSEKRMILYVCTIHPPQHQKPG